MTRQCPAPGCTRACEPHFAHCLAHTLALTAGAFGPALESRAGSPVPRPRLQRVAAPPA